MLKKVDKKKIWNRFDCKEIWENEKVEVKQSRKENEKKGKN